VTRPPTSILIRCPGCGLEYPAFHRPSINRGLGEEWTDEQIESATTVSCPDCGQRVAPGALVVRGDVWELR